MEHSGRRTVRSFATRERWRYWVTVVILVTWGLGLWIPTMLRLIGTIGPDESASRSQAVVNLCLASFLLYVCGRVLFRFPSHVLLMSDDSLRFLWLIGHTDVPITSIQRIELKKKEMALVTERNTKDDPVYGLDIEFRHAGGSLLLPFTQGSYRLVQELTQTYPAIQVGPRLKESEHWPASVTGAVERWPSPAQWEATEAARCPDCGAPVESDDQVCCQCGQPLPT